MNYKKEVITNEHDEALHFVSLTFSQNTRRDLVNMFVNLQTSFSWRYIREDGESSHQRRYKLKPLTSISSSPWISWTEVYFSFSVIIFPFSSLMVHWLHNILH